MPGLAVCRLARAIYIVREIWWGCAGAREVIAVMQNRQTGDVDLVKGYIVRSYGTKRLVLTS